MKNAPKHDPTPEEIRDACERIRAGWSETVEQSHAGVYAAKPVELDRVLVREVLACK